MKQLSIALLVMLGAANPLEAQTCGTTNITGTCSITNLNISISFTRAVKLLLSSSATALTAPTGAAYNTGYAATNGPTITISSNANWTLAANATAATWTGVTTTTEAARANKPSTDLMWSTSSGSGFVGLTTSPVTIQSGTPSSSTVINLFYRTLYAWNVDTPGNYSIQVVFTLTAP
jgi:hypothetical protein